MQISTRLVGASAIMTFSMGPLPLFSTVSWRASIAAAADEALSYLI